MDDRTSGQPATGVAGSARRAALTRRVRLLVAAMITYNVIEAVIALAAGTASSSAALVGFGWDSIIEVASTAAVAWQFAGREPAARERAALWVIALSFFALAKDVSVESVRALAGTSQATPSTGRDRSGRSVVGCDAGAVSCPAPSRSELGSRSAVADSKQTMLCTYLSGVLLVGFLVNSLFGWAWADRSPP